MLELIERKAAGETELVQAPQPVSTDKVVDLMAALEASVSAAKEARKRHPTGRPADDKPADGEAEEATKPVRVTQGRSQEGGTEEAQERVAAEVPKRVDLRGARVEADGRHDRRS